MGVGGRGAQPAALHYVPWAVATAAMQASRRTAQALIERMTLAVGWINKWMTDEIEGRRLRRGARRRPLFLWVGGVGWGWVDR